MKGLSGRVRVLGMRGRTHAWSLGAGAAGRGCLGTWQRLISGLARANPAAPKLTGGLQIHWPLLLLERRQGCEAVLEAPRLHAFIATSSSSPGLGFQVSSPCGRAGDNRGKAVAKENLPTKVSARTRRACVQTATTGPLTGVQRMPASIRCPFSKDVMLTDAAQTPLAGGPLLINPLGPSINPLLTLLIPPRPQVCATCGLPFTWRKKWEKVWDEVR